MVACMKQKHALLTCKAAAHHSFTTLVKPVNAVSQQNLLEVIKAPVYCQAHSNSLSVHSLDY